MPYIPLSAGTAAKMMQLISIIVKKHSVYHKSICVYADTKPRDKKMQQILFKPYLSVLHSAASVTPNRVHYLTEVQRKSSGLSQPLSMVLILLSTVDSVQLLSVVLILSCVRFCIFEY